MAPTEDSELAEALIADAIDRAPCAPRVVHADRGSSMTSRCLAELLTELGVARTHSRPKTSNDNRRADPPNRLS